MYIAHSREDGTEQKLKDHLENTANLAGEFGKVFNNEEYAYICGLLHDIGKYSDEFQRRIKNNGKRCDHSTAGARLVKGLVGSGKLLAYCIAGHHGGLSNYGHKSDIGNERTLCSRLYSKYIIPQYDNYKEEIPEEKLKLKPIPNIKMYGNQKDVGLTFYFFIKMLYSCLTDADFLDTEWFMNSGIINRKVSYDFKNMRNKLEQKLNGFKNYDGIINQKRKEILNNCINKATLPRGLFTLTVPTGGGKTLSSMAFALNHLLKNGLNRIIYVIPYTSIIEQNAKVFSEIFGSSNILEHHSNYDFTSTEDDFNNIKRLATQNWDMPIIITTNVQFFESFYTNKSSRLRKLHNIANSVIIFDEAQMIPVEYLDACTKAIAELVFNYCCTAVLCSATQPAIVDRFPKEINCVEICENRNELYEVFKRTEIVNRGELNTEELAKEMNDELQCLTILNTRKHALKLFSMLEGEGIYHLSTLMCPVHRFEVILEIKKHLKNQQPCKVVSTRLIEAGVDVDFPKVYRAYAGLDSIIQSAGRGNREGKLKDKDGNLICGKVHIFKPDEEFTKKQPLNFKRPIEITEEIMRQYQDITSPEAIEDYFRKLYFYSGDIGLDVKEIIKRINEGVPKAKNADDLFNYPFEDIANDFKLIEENTYSIIIPFDEKAEKLIQNLKYAEFIGEPLRALQGYTVNIYETEYKKIYGAGKLEILHEEIAILRDIKDYDSKTGINIEIETGIGIFI